MNNVVFCIGDIIAKRKAMIANSTVASSIYIDNDDVAIDFLHEDKCYFLFTKMPFAKFKVGQYIAYKTSLAYKKRLDTVQIQSLLRAVKAPFSINKKLGKLNAVEYRNMLISYKVNMDITKIYINFDGIPYTKKTSKALNRLCSTLSKNIIIYVSVSDSRFIAINTTTHIYDKNCTYIEVPYVAFKSCQLKKKKIAQLVKKKHFAFNKDEIICGVVTNA